MVTVNVGKEANFLVGALITSLNGLRDEGDGRQKKPGLVRRLRHHGNSLKESLAWHHQNMLSTSLEVSDSSSEEIK